MRVWRCTGAPASQGRCRPECSSTKGQWRSQRSSTPNGYIWSTKTVHGVNRIDKDYLANRFWWEVLDGWRSLETSHWSSGSSAGISRSSCWCTISVSIAQWFMYWSWSATPRSCKCLLCFLLLDWTYDDTKPCIIHSSNWRLVPFEGVWPMELVEPFSVVTGWIQDLTLSFESKFRSSCLTMIISRRSSMIRNHGSRGCQSLT